MKKRITAAFLSLVMLISILPAAVFAAEEEKIYQLGEDIWVVGTPTAKTEEGTKWAYVLGMDGLPESREGECPLEIHKHSGSCRDTSGNLICGKEAHPRHTTKCQMDNALWHWIVVVDPNYIPPATTPTDPPTEDQGPGYSDPNEEHPEGSASFTLRNIDPQGKPLQNVEYYLLSGDRVVMGNYQTNENGEIFFGGLQLRDGVNAEVWELYQNPPLPDALTDYYEENHSKWNVTVIRNGDSDTFFVSNITLAEEETDAAEGEQYKQGYDSVTNTVTVVNQHKLYNIMITLKPVLVTEEGQETASIPSDMTVKVTVEKDDGEVLEVNLPNGSSPQAYLEGLTAGTYTVTGIECENTEMKGFVLGQPYAVLALPKPSDEAERPVLDQNHVQLGSKYSHPDFWIYLPYKLSSNLTVRVMDENNTQLKGSVVVLKDGDTVIHEFNEENGYDIDLKDHAVEGQTVKYTLEQTKAPDGYHLSEEKYVVSVSADTKDGTPQISVKKDQSFLQVLASLFSGDFAIDSETGNQLAIFTNVRKTTQIKVTSRIETVFDENDWQDAEIEEILKKEKNTFTLTWKDISGEAEPVTMTLAADETKTFEADVPYGASYKIEAFDGYGYTPVYSGVAEGTIGVDDVEQNAPLEIEAQWMYTFEPGEAQTMKLVLVDAEDTRKTLPGVAFDLRMNDVDETDVYETDNSGTIRIRASRPCSFTLEQKEEPEGYIKLSTPIQVDVGLEYTAKEGSTIPVLVQNIVPYTAHEAVEQQADGSWLIKNTPVEVGEEITDEHSNKLLIRVVDESGNQVEGTAVTMGDKNYTNGDIIDMEALVKEGQTLTYSVVQTKSVVGHQIAGEKYTVTVSRKNDKVTVNVEDANQGVLGQIFNKTEIPYGPDREWVLTFVNTRMTAQLRLTCEVAVNFIGGSWHDMEFEKKYKEETEYEFLLSWEDDFTREQESAKLVHGQSHLFDMQVPYGVEYKIICVNEKGYFDTTFRNAKSTIVDTTALREGMQITATNTYIIEPDPDADPAELHLTKVDASSKEPLEGVAFELLDADERKLASYTTGADGKIDIVDTLKIGGSYSLKETEALKGYEKPSAPFGIKVDAKYKLFTATGKPVLKQSFEASISHKTIEKQEDGSYIFKNYKEGEAPRGTYSGNPKTGDGFDAALWSCVMSFSMVAIVLMVVGTAKKRRVK